MTIRRSYLFWGTFLVLVGGIPLFVRWSGVDIGEFGRSWSWWPVVLIVLGVAIVFARSRLNVAAVALVGVLLGGLVGTALASGGSSLFGGLGCAGGRSDLDTYSQSGTFAPSGAVQLRHSCGSLSLRPTTGSSWTLTAQYHGSAPDVLSSGSSLEIESLQEPFQRQDWALFLPVSSTRSVDAQVNAGSGSVDVSGMDLGDASLQGNAADLTVVAEGGRIGVLNLQINAGRARITLDEPVSDGQLEVNAGQIELCVAPDAGLTLAVQERFAFTTSLGNSGLSHTGSTWSRPATGSGPLISLTVQGNAASFTLDPAGGCQ